MQRKMGIFSYSFLVSNLSITFENAGQRNVYLFSVTLIIAIPEAARGLHFYVQEGPQFWDGALGLRANAIVLSKVLTVYLKQTYWFKMLLCPHQSVLWGIKKVGSTLSRWGEAFSVEDQQVP